jgi:hypothetical protein
MALPRRSAAEARGALDAHDVRDLRRVEQRGDARHQVLAERGRRAEQVREGAASSATCGASVAASACSLRGVVTSMTRVTPAICAACAATANRRGEHGDDDFRAGERAAAFTHFAVER